MTAPQSTLPQQAPDPNQLPLKLFVAPNPGETITSAWSKNTYTIGPKIGEGNFSVVFACKDIWNNDLAAKVLKPLGKPYEDIRANAQAELGKLVALRHPHVTYIFDAFEFRDTFYIITERCYFPVAAMLANPSFKGILWIPAIARCLLQAVHYLHVEGYVHQDIHAGNVFASIIKDEMLPDDPNRKAIQFKLGDLGIAKSRRELSVQNTRAQWMLPPEVLDEAQFGPIDHRLDIYHTGLLLLQLAYDTNLRFSREEVLAGRPREMALALPAPFNFALEKCLRRHAQFRTNEAMELWRDLNVTPPTPAIAVLPVT